MTTPKVLTPVEEMRSNFERTGTLAPMYARAMFVELTALTATNKKLRDALQKAFDAAVPDNAFSWLDREVRVKNILRAALKEEEG